MSDKRFLAIALALVLAAFAYRAAAAADLTGTWAISPAAAAGKIYFDLTIEDPQRGHTHSNNGSDFSPSDLGLTPQQLGGSGHHVSFTISRDAGTFACDGWVANGRGGGSATFTPSSNYVSKMNARGYDPSSDQVVSAAMLDLSLAYMDGITAAGVEKPSFDDLIAMRALRVDGPYIAGLHSAGLDVTKARQLIELKALNVDAAFVKSFAAIGYSGLSSRQLVELRALKIDADYVRRVKAHGIAHPTVEDLVRLKSLNVI